MMFLTFFQVGKFGFVSNPNYLMHLSFIFAIIPISKLEDVSFFRRSSSFSFRIIIFWRLRFAILLDNLVSSVLALADVFWEGFRFSLEVCFGFPSLLDFSSCLMSESRYSSSSLDGFFEVVGASGSSWRFVFRDCTISRGLSFCCFLKFSFRGCENVLCFSVSSDGFAFLDCKIFVFDLSLPFLHLGALSYGLYDCPWSLNVSFVQR